MTGLADATPFSGDGSGTAVRRPGGRTARVRAEVLSAVEEELAEHGYDALTIDGVAARSGVHRTTIYRRWKTVDGLLVDLLEAGRDDTWAPADTGSLLTDLVALNREVRSALTGSASPAEGRADSADAPAGTTVTTAVIAASFRSPAAAEALSRFWEDRYRRSGTIITRAIDRGELPADTDADRVLMAATSPLYHQFILRRAPMTLAEADHWARATAAAATAGLYRRT
ncbi:TetR family transcriptional regulator [Kribbella sp. ALI-6-A]|uniref:TetR/AcrR family transcriptional regulator n=1 Tax=Kribbella sp. ALI-6-A TaxID=1933817 RepID=UPI00097C3C2B|nr:TetR/AcrR family transcriptional regulator [Kribbella sp. ALI-6-A]ONI67916.1 TetR family transcriptional regulator [Kribbella sp. ALI-6-A]